MSMMVENQLSVAGGGISSGVSGQWAPGLFFRPPLPGVDRSGGEVDARERFGKREDLPGTRQPRILIVTPEISYLPEAMGGPGNGLRAKAGGLADVAALLVEALSRKGADVHVALPHYRQIFDGHAAGDGNGEGGPCRPRPADGRVHLAEDRCFYYRDRIYDHREDAKHHMALAFQREVINNILPRVQPDIVHCHDWMTGLIPAAAKRLGIPSLFTVHNIHTERISLAHMEHLGIDASDFWNSLYFERLPENYQETRDGNRADLLASGIYASSVVNTVSPTFLDEIVGGHHDFVPEAIRRELGHKRTAGIAHGILNTPDPSCDAATDRALKLNYTSESAKAGKAGNKQIFQEATGLETNPEAPLFFWPSRLDPVQKGCQLVSDLLHEMVSRYRDTGIQFAFVADGPFQEHFYRIADLHGIRNRVAVRDFSEPLSRLGYAASDFTLMPSLFEPCGLSQMIAAMYGSLPVVRDTGGLSDTVTHMNLEEGTGNGFVFRDFDGGGLRWAIEEAMRFFARDRAWREDQVARVMRESRKSFHPDRAVSRYEELYEEVAKQVEGASVRIG